ncbi:Carbohydrate-selective porin [Thermodesulfovibrio sp. N1]|uniref:carbohydrate porin n=1 Tax=unclassified Thermodesulfovibrio TaxID=2645936 RepID=UPI00083B8298|nr:MULTISPECIES: carbohydrate porin [unclassified Thermodesulfovibrio]MDI1471849.1 carbohydrate porin [Thermodesulfovibrio sp. 1176]ODA44825.1 Carbohydrate-selective porin [Thermodesulfovibrio sp. N1]
MKAVKSFAFAVLSLLFPFTVYAADIIEWLSISGSATGVYQWLNKTQGDIENKDRGSTVIDFNVSIKPIENSEIFLRASFAKGSGLKDINPFILSPNADDLFSDLKNINGHPRDHLLELWYSHKFPIEKEIFLKFTAGIIDSTAFIDDNIYANDELGQFMNEAFVNNPLANLPSYDAGVSVEFEWDKIHLRLVGMRSKNDYERRFNWIGAQVGYKLETTLGEGNYRLYAYTTNKRFKNWDSDGYKSLKGIGVSFDQQLIKDTLGAFFRAGLQDDSAVIDYNRMVSFGFNLNGSIWGRKDDEIGIGYAYLKSPPKNEELLRSRVFESYLKFKLFSYKAISSDITLDYQYIQDKTREEGTKAGNIYGIRFSLNF